MAEINWNNTSEVTTLEAGDGINIVSEEGIGTPVIKVALNSLSTGILKNTVVAASGTTPAVGTLSRAVPGVDYVEKIIAGNGMKQDTTSSKDNAIGDITISIADNLVIPATSDFYSCASIIVDQTGVVTNVEGNSLVGGDGIEIIETGPVNNTAIRTFNLATVGTASTSQPSAITTDAFGRVTSSLPKGMIVLTSSSGTSGSGTLGALLPAGITSGKVTVVGGGGGGGDGEVGGTNGAGGGAGGAAIAYVTNLSSATSYYVGSGGANNTAGSPSTFGTGTTQITANGGAPGEIGTSSASSTGGTGGTASLGSALIGKGVTFRGGGGDGGSIGGGNTSTGAGGNSIFGGGGKGLTGSGGNSGEVGAANTGGGGSGSSGSVQLGGAGGSGVIIIEY